MKRKRTDSNTVHLAARVPVDLLEALGNLARENERTVSGELRLALTNWVNPQAVKDRNGR